MYFSLFGLIGNNVNKSILDEYVANECKQRGHLTGNEASPYVSYLGFCEISSAPHRSILLRHTGYEVALDTRQIDVVMSFVCRKSVVRQS